MRRQPMPGHVTGGQCLSGEEDTHADDRAKSRAIAASLIHSRVECPMGPEMSE